MKKTTEVKITITEIDGVIVNVHPEVRNIELKKVTQQVPRKVLKEKEPKEDDHMKILKCIFGDSIVTNLYSEYLKEFVCNPIKANANLK